MADALAKSEQRNLVCTMTGRVQRMFSSLVFHTRSLGLVSVVLALGGLPQSAVAEETAEREIGVDILEMCIDPETSNQAIVDYLLERDWQFVELEEAKTLVPPKDVDAFSPEQIFGFAYYAFSFGSSHRVNGYDPRRNIDEFMGRYSRLDFFVSQDQSISLFGPNDEVMNMRFRLPGTSRDNLEERTRTQCSFSALRQSPETDLFDVTPDEPTSYDFVTIESDNTDLTGPMVAYVVITAEAALLSDVFETEVPALVVFWVRVDLDAD